MSTRVLLLLTVALLIASASCGGGDKHLPSSNPPEYDPKKVYTSPSVSPPAPQSAKSAALEPPPIELPSLEPGPDEKGEWRKMPVKPESFQQLKGVKTVCDALSQLVQGLGSAQLFAGAEGAALKKSLGSQAESTAQMLDQQLAESLKQTFGSGAANCPLFAQPHKSSSLQNRTQPARIVLTKSSSSHPLLLAQAATSQGSDDGYTIRTTKQKQDAPPGWIGGKTTDRTSRVGNKPETAGNQSSHALVLGGKVVKCPTPEGVVAGDFEYAVVLDETIADRGVTRAIHISLHASATLKGQVDDNAAVQYIEGDLTTVAERGGTDVPSSVRRRRSQFRFVPSRDESYPGFPTNIIGLSATGWDIGGASQQEDSFAGDAAGAVMFWGGANVLGCTEGMAQAEYLRGDHLHAGHQDT